jgi:predicted nucleic acid-binding protein
MSGKEDGLLLPPVLKVTGILGLLARAKSVGIIQEMTPFVEKALRSGVRYHPDLVRRVLEMVKE